MHKTAVCRQAAGGGELLAASPTNPAIALPNWLCFGIVGSAVTDRCVEPIKEAGTTSRDIKHQSNEGLPLHGPRLPKGLPRHHVQARVRHAADLARHHEPQQCGVADDRMSSSNPAFGPQRAMPGEQGFGFRLAPSPGKFMTVATLLLMMVRMLGIKFKLCVGSKSRCSGFSLLSVGADEAFGC